ncbi:MAG: DUF616 domain-containing protein [Lachnospiraceae bacterium]|nr:glycosyltransferase domain-containing protein [uncultured Acetatifactor sp.]MCI9220662.1 DUF616 domain-containing protein [Lachnospiraceae bacterium]
MRILDRIRSRQKNGRKLIIYCAGLHGQLFFEVLKVCGISIDFFCDSDSDKWGKTIRDDIVCISPGELKKNDCMGFICVGKACYEEVLESIQRERLFEVIEISAVIDDLILNDRELYFSVLRNHGKQKAADLFYDLHPNGKKAETNATEKDLAGSPKRTAVYTAVFGGYDSACFPQFVNREMDYFYVSDEKPKDLPEYYHWVDAREIIPNYITSPIKRNRYVKMHPHLFLGAYAYSVYMDGNILIKDDISSFLRESRTGISVFMHPMRECIYYEALSIVNFKRVNADDVCRQMNRYFAEGMPYRYGLAEMPVIAREHMKTECIDVMETWWDEFDSESQRDQLSFMYALWKNNFTLDDLESLGEDVRKCSRIEFCSHVKESRNVKNQECRRASL